MTLNADQTCKKGQGDGPHYLQLGTASLKDKITFGFDTRIVGVFMNIERRGDPRHLIYSSEGTQGPHRDIV